jgi:NAD(P)H-nitrite reductase large subunit
MIPREVDFLLIGGGYASVTAAEALRLESSKQSVLILSDEGYAPYHRPSLSKLYLRGTANDQQILIHPENFYREQSIELQLNTRAIAVDSTQQLVTTARDEKIRFGKLLIATGLAPEQLSIPGTSLAGVYSLRRKADCDAIRLSAAKAKQIVVLAACRTFVPIIGWNLR